MTEGAINNKDNGALLKVLTAQYNALVAARGDESLLKQYAALLRFLKSSTAQFLQEGSHVKGSGTERSRPEPTISEEQLCNASLDDLHRIVSNEETSRRDLEFIATHRFSVPRGSMRSFSNRQMLIDKLANLISNERTHETISTVARGEPKDER